MVVIATIVTIIWKPGLRWTFNGLIIQLEQIFWKIVSIFRLFLSESNVEQKYLKIYVQLSDLFPIKHKPWKLALKSRFS